LKTMHCVGVNKSEQKAISKNKLIKKGLGFVFPPRDSRI